MDRWLATPGCPQFSCHLFQSFIGATESSPSPCTGRHAPLVAVDLVPVSDSTAVGRHDSTATATTPDFSGTSGPPSELYRRSRAPGSDEITNNALRAGVVLIASHLTRILNITAGGFQSNPYAINIGPLRAPHCLNARPRIQCRPDRAVQ